MKLAVWGANSYGQLGTGTKSELIAEPVYLDAGRLHNLNDLETIVAISGGGGHSLLLSSDGEVYGCGWNKIGQLLVDEPSVLEFVKLPLLENYHVTQLASLWDSSFAVTQDHKCLAWGSNAYGQFGSATNQVSEIRPRVVAHDVKQVACGARHTVILCNNGTVLTAGDNKFGKLGRDKLSTDPSFCQVPDLKNIKSVACGFNHSVAVSEDSKIYVWGSNKWGQLGKDPKDFPCIERPKELNRFPGIISSVHAGWSSTHLLTEDGRVFNFGRNNYGQLGQKYSPDINPWEMHSLHQIQDISVGAEHALALTDEDHIVSWGWNEHGSCGNGAVENQFSPSDVLIDKSNKVIRFAAASGHNFALLKEE